MELNLYELNPCFLHTASRDRQMFIVFAVDYYILFSRPDKLVTVASLIFLANAGRLFVVILFQRFVKLAADKADDSPIFLLSAARLTAADSLVFFQRLAMLLAVDSLIFFQILASLAEVVSLIFLTRLPKVDANSLLEVVSISGSLSAVSNFIFGSMASALSASSFTSLLMVSPILLRKQSNNLRINISVIRVSLVFLPSLRVLRQVLMVFFDLFGLHLDHPQQGLIVVLFTFPSPGLELAEHWVNGEAVFRLAFIHGDFADRVHRRWYLSLG